MRVRRIYPLVLVALAALIGLAAVIVAGTRLLLQRNERQQVLQQTDNVVTAMRELSRLETAEYHIERVIDLRNEQPLLYGTLQEEDVVLLVAAGDVVAGVDLSRLRPSDVVFDAAHGAFTVHLPPPEIFHARLDEGHTYVHSRRTDLLATRDEGLEGRARQIALSSFEKAARERGILDKAKTHADRLLRSLLREVGARQVNLLWSLAPPQT